jgi:hypothetical protein
LLELIEGAVLPQRDDDVGEFLLKLGAAPDRDAVRGRVERVGDDAEVTMHCRLVLEHLVVRDVGILLPQGLFDPLLGGVDHVRDVVHIMPHSLVDGRVGVLEEDLGGGASFAAILDVLLFDEVGDRLDGRRHLGDGEEGGEVGRVGGDDDEAEEPPAGGQDARRRLQQPHKVPQFRD